MFYGVGEDFDNGDFDETAECHHGVSFCDPCEDCEDESVPTASHSGGRMSPQIPKCPSCKKEKQNDKPTQCKDRFHIWHCSNNVTPGGCLGHSPGAHRCLDEGGVPWL